MMGQGLLETTSPLLHFLYLAPPFYYWAGRVCSLRKVRPSISTEFPFFSFMFLVLFPVAVAGVEILLRGASFSQLCRLSFSLLFVSLLVVAGGGQVAVVTGHEAKLLCPSHALDDGEKIT